MVSFPTSVPRLLALACATALPCVAPARASRASIAWQPSLAAAFDAAKADGAVVFLAVNMDGERSNDRLAREVYADPSIVRLAAHTKSLVASAFTHAAGDAECTRFGSQPCRVHLETDRAVRTNGWIQEGSEGFIAPQHVFLNAEREVLLQVPFAITRGELEWCFVAAIRTQNPEFEWEFSSTARAPKRLATNGVAVPEEDATVPLLTREEMLDLIEQMKRRTIVGAARREAIRKVLRSDEVEAIEFAHSLLRAGPGGPNGRDIRPIYLRDIGANSPASYWEIVAEFAESGEDELRKRAVIALEQLGAAESVKVLRRALAKEKDPAIERDLLRALASAGADDARVRKEILTRCRKEKDALVRIGAVLALGHLVEGEDVRELLNALVTDEDPNVRAAAVCAMAITRDAAWLPVLRALRDQATDESMREVVGAALLVFDQGSLAPLRITVKRIAGDELDRPRIFGG